MNGKYLLDTNIVIAIFNRESTVLKKLAETNEVFLPVIVVGDFVMVHINRNILERI